MRFTTWFLLFVAVEIANGFGASPSSKPSDQSACSSDCEAEFVNRCVPYGPGGYAGCRNEIETGTGPLRFKCVVGCTNTPEMDELAPSPGGELSSSTFTLQNGGETRPVTVLVPDGAGPFPLMLAFHGNGGTGAGTCNGLSRMNSWAAPTVSTHILVCPDGISKSWNIVDEMAFPADDVAFVHAILDYLAPFGNVDATATLMYGSSNGAALCNRILIESDDPRIIRAVMEVSQLNDKQYRNGNFYIGGRDNAYTTVKSTLYPREVLSLQGAEDNLIPAAGGPTNVGPFEMVSDTDSIYAYAMAYGYTGSQRAPSFGSGYKYWVYPGVESYTAFGAGHNVLSSNPKQQLVDLVQAFVARPPP